MAVLLAVPGHSLGDAMKIVAILHLVSLVGLGVYARDSSESWRRRLTLVFAGGLVLTALFLAVDTLAR